MMVGLYKYSYKDLFKTCLDYLLALKQSTFIF